LVKLIINVKQSEIMRPITALEIPFEKNVVLNLVVWLNLRGQGLVGVEDCYRVTETGTERLSRLDKEILIK